MSTSRFLLSLTAGLALATFVSASDEPTLEQRLEKLAESLETAREHAHIPGMAVCGNPLLCSAARPGELGPGGAGQ